MRKPYKSIKLPQLSCPNRIRQFAKARRGNTEEGRDLHLINLTIGASFLTWRPMVRNTEGGADVLQQESSDSAA